MAAKAIENMATLVPGPDHSLGASDTGHALWYLFTHSTVEAVRVTAISVSTTQTSYPKFVEGQHCIFTVICTLQINYLNCNVTIEGY